jgi:hypothetical protein
VECRAPTPGQVIPTPNPGEHVVFVPHFLCGFGFPLHPFLWGLLFFYGLDFHDLAPKSLFHISTFILFYEAFLRVQPHFGLWLQLFGVKQRSAKGDAPECDGASFYVLDKNNRLPGVFLDTMRGWRSSWFYLTEPREAEWAEATAFRSESPTRLQSWIEKGIPWGQETEVALLSEWMARMIDLHLYDVVQVMLEHRVLPLQERKKALWEFSPIDPKTVLSLLHHSREKMWKSLFLTEEDMPGHIKPFPEEGTDWGLSEEADGDQVQTLCPKSFNNL